jgi:hypothetical protein
VLENGFDFDRHPWFSASFRGGGYRNTFRALVLMPRSIALWVRGHSRDGNTGRRVGPSSRKAMPDNESYVKLARELPSARLRFARWLAPSPQSVLVPARADFSPACVRMWGHVENSRWP